MIETLLKLKVSAPALAFAFFFAAERLRPAETGPGAARLVRNGGLWLMFMAASAAIGLPLAIFAASHSMWTREGILASPAALAVDLLILDLWAYATHRAYHQVPLLWRVHAPHHLDEHLDTTTALRFHFAEIAASAMFRTPLIMAAAIPIQHVVVYDALLMCAALFHHSNLRLPATFERAVSRLVVTPSLHWMHHHAERRDTDSNYGGVLSLWDRLFGTRNPRSRAPSMKIGVEGMPDRPLWELVLLPFAAKAPRP